MKYKEGDKVITKDGLEYIIQKGRVVKTRNFFEETPGLYSYVEYKTKCGITLEETIILTKKEKGFEKTDVFKKITEDMLQLYKDKNADYGDSFKKVRDKYPNAIVVRLLDKMGRLESLYTKDNIKVINENIDDTLIDIANYCIMEMVEREIKDKS